MSAAAPANAQIQFGLPTTLAAGDFPASLATADLDGDGDLDLVVVNRTSDDAYVYLGDGAGGFSFSTSFAVGNFPQGVAAADLDADPDADVVTTAVPFNSGTATAWLGNGDGTFQSASVNVADDGTRSVELALIDGDSHLDLVVTNPTRDNISVFLGVGDGTFGAEIRTAVGLAGAYPTDLEVADFDEDGDLDVVTSNAQSSNNSISLLLGDGDGTFATPVVIATGCDRPESVVAGDFDDDLHIDVAVSCFVSDEVVVFLGNGLGGMATPVAYDLGNESGSYWILSEDFDLDGDLDLVTANNGSFSVLSGNGDGTFAAAVATSALGTFFGATTGDFDGDGLPDLAITNQGLDEVWIYLNAAAPAVPLSIPAWLLAGVLSVSGCVLLHRHTRGTVPRVPPSTPSAL